MEIKLNEAVNISSSISLKLPWKCPFSEFQDKILSSIGEEELYGVGKQLAQTFPELFSEKYSPLLYNFESSCKLRCVHSANALALGLFEGTGTVGKYKSQPIAIKVLPCDNDPVLRFFQICKKYTVNVLKRKSSLYERDEFDKGPEMRKVKEKVLEKLGMVEKKLKVKDLKAIYLACSYDLSMFNSTSGICSLLDEEDKSVLEYSLDLKHFYTRSTGYKINYQSSCLLLMDIIDSIKSAASNSSHSYIGIFRSSHAETIIPLFAILGLHVDEEKLVASNYNEMKRRRFRGACLSPFSGNLYIILYNCQNDGYKIQLYVNEQLTKVPCCESASECKLETFLRCFKKDIIDCHFEQICNLDHTEL